MLHTCSDFGKTLSAPNKKGWPNEPAGKSSHLAKLTIMHECELGKLSLKNEIQELLTLNKVFTLRIHIHTPP